MTVNKLQVTQTSTLTTPPRQNDTRGARRQEVQAAMERLWLQDPEQFNPMRDCVQRKRVSRTIDTLRTLGSLENRRAVDLGCGSGEITRLIRDLKMDVHAIDAATKALELLKKGDMERITAAQDCLPTTRLDDDSFDLVVCTEVIGYLKPVEYRLFFAELARLVKREGTVACSTSLDVDSDNALEKFAALAETEFEIDKWVLSYDLLWIRWCGVFETPMFYFKTHRDKNSRIKELEKRGKLGRLWLKLNTTLPIAFLWRGIAFFANPIASFIRQSNFLMDALEKVTKFFWNESGISNALFIGKRRPMTYPLPADELPREMKHKRQVWE